MKEEPRQWSERGRDRGKGACGDGARCRVETRGRTGREGRQSQVRCYPSPCDRVLNRHVGMPSRELGAGDWSCREDRTGDEDLGTTGMSVMLELGVWTAGVSDIVLTHL